MRITTHGNGNVQWPQRKKAEQYLLKRPSNKGNSATDI